MQKPFKIILFLGVFLLLAGCATPNIPLSNSFWQNKPKSIAVATTSLPKAGFYSMGSQGIVDLLIANAATQTFHNNLTKYNLAAFASLQTDFTDRLRKAGITAINYKQVIAVNQLPTLNKDTASYAHHDFSAYLNQIGSDKLLLITLSQVGSIRQYYGFIPLDAPHALCYAEGRLIDLRTNHILWRQQVNIIVPVSGPWDQPPNYPNFNRALDTAVATAKLQLLTSFFGT